MRCATLTTKMPLYRLFLPDKVYGPLHDFKRLAQNAVMLVDMNTRESNAFEGAAYDDAIDSFKSAIPKLERLYSELTTELHKSLNI